MYMYICINIYINVYIHIFMYNVFKCCEAQSISVSTIPMEVHLRMSVEVHSCTQLICQIRFMFLCVIRALMFQNVINGFWLFKLLSCLFVRLRETTCNKLEEKLSQEEIVHCLQWEKNEAPTDIKHPCTTYFFFCRGSQHVIHPSGRRWKGKGHSYLNIIICN